MKLIKDTFAALLDKIEDVNDRYGHVLIIALVVGVLAGLIALYGAAFRQWEQGCIDQGGHVISSTSTSTGVGVGGDGKPVTTVSSHTTYYCLNAQGGIIDILEG